jgi:hypothetical protein
MEINRISIQLNIKSNLFFVIVDLTSTRFTLEK